MKLWYSFIKELQLSSKSWYFYIEIGMACVLLLILVFVIPAESDDKVDEYLYAGGLPRDYQELLYRGILDEEDEPIPGKRVEIEVEDDSYEALLFVTDTRNLYFVENLEAVRTLADKEGAIGIEIVTGKEGSLIYRYYLQGYESLKLKNLYRLLHNDAVNPEFIRRHLEVQTVKSLGEESLSLNNKENVLPVFLTYNGSMMGLFIIAAYIFLDKQEGIIRAYAVTTSSIWHYLLSKVGVLTVTMITTSLLIVVPLMGFEVNYLNLLALVITSAFAFSSLGLLVTTYYRNMMQSFGVFYILIVAMMVPSITYFLPGFEPRWVQWIPTYHLLEGFKDIIAGGGNGPYILKISLGFVLGGLLLFVYANHRFKKTLTLS
ncbi:MAG: hypothetical protein AVO33_05945 [delta proteobacterium ML8_F1]|nr:MAG: hypothetical protein AVO33_05945 [delta proteobacterium ML8_F1]